MQDRELGRSTTTTDTMRDGIPTSPVSSTPEKPAKNKRIKTLAKNSAANVVRLGVTSLVAIVLPGYLTHRLPVQTYAAWVLILQVGAYVAYLDFGVQTAIAKFIAEYEAKHDDHGCNRAASVGLVIMLVAGILGALITLAFAWQIPALFKNVPSNLLSEIRVSVLLVGFSLSIGLPASVFSSIFLGLQRYQIPMLTGVFSKLAYGLVVIAAAYQHSSLLYMAAGTACINVLTALLQILLWKRLGNRIRVSFRAADYEMTRQMIQYCGILTIWTVCMLFITGLDVTIVGHYAFNEVGFYSIATSPTNLIIMLIGAILGPLLPATSALSVERSSNQMGNILLRTTRYSTMMLLLTGLPVLVGGYFILHLWVGTMYATRSILYLRILLAANILRNFCAPYATMVVATSQQRLATASAITEGVVNLTASVLLASRFGAIGVAAGTLIGSFVGVAMHFTISMNLTQASLTIPPRKLLLKGILRPSVLAIPSLVFIPYWWGSGLPSMNGLLWLAWGVMTILLTWFVSMNGEDRATLIGMAVKLRSSLV